MVDSAPGTHQKISLVTKSIQTTNWVKIWWVEKSNPPFPLYNGMFIFYINYFIVFNPEVTHREFFQV